MLTAVSSDWTLADQTSSAELKSADGRSFVVDVLAVNDYMKILWPSVNDYIIVPLVMLKLHRLWH